MCMVQMEAFDSDICCFSSPKKESRGEIAYHLILSLPLRSYYYTDLAALEERLVEGHELEPVVRPICEVGLSLLCYTG